MPYVEYDGADVVAIYARPQSGVVTQQRAENHPDVTAFRNRKREEPLTAREVADALIARGGLDETDLPLEKRRR